MRAHIVNIKGLGIDIVVDRAGEELTERSRADI